MNLIVNVTEDWAIGNGNQLLVSISADLKRFAQLTKGKILILGRKTLETFPGGRPLKNRVNLILSANPQYQVEGAQMYRSLPELLEAVKQYPDEDVCVIGGASVYEALLPYCRKAFVTKTYGDYEADRYFPNLDKMENWEMVRQEPMQEENGISFQYLDYENRDPKSI